MGTEWVLCQSSNLHSYRWVEGDEYPLQIRFHLGRTGGTRSYGYQAPRSEYQALYDTPGSKGIHFNKHIKNIYPCKPLD